MIRSSSLMIATLSLLATPALAEKDMPGNVPDLARAPAEIAVPTPELKTEPAPKPVTPAPVTKTQDSTSAQPIEITAQKALEWNSTTKQYIARQDAKAVQGDFSVTGDTLIADYREGTDGSTQIYRLTAEGNVTVNSGTSTATGDKAVYDVDTAKATLTGNDLKMVGENLNVTAKERFEYYSSEGKLMAFGRPLVKSGTDTLEADKITAWIDRSGAKPATPSPAASTGNLKRVEADGNVVIITPTEHATSDRATYDTGTQLSELIGHAVVKRDKDVMSGERAEMNMTTKVSKMFGSGTKDGRVKGVFYPAKSKKSAPTETTATN